MTEIYGTTKDSVVNLSNFTAELLNTGGVGFNKIIDMEFSDDVKAAEFNFKKGLRMTDTVAKLPIGDRASKLQLVLVSKENLEKHIYPIMIQYLEQNVFANYVSMVVAGVHTLCPSHYFSMKDRKFYLVYQAPGAKRTHKYAPIGKKTIKIAVNQLLVITGHDGRFSNAVRLWFNLLQKFNGQVSAMNAQKGLRGKIGRDTQYTDNQKRIRYARRLFKQYIKRINPAQDVLKTLTATQALAYIGEQFSWQMKQLENRIEDLDNKQTPMALMMISQLKKMRDSGAYDNGKIILQKLPIMGKSKLDSQWAETNSQLLEVGGGVQSLSDQKSQAGHAVTAKKFSQQSQFMKGQTQDPDGNILSGRSFSVTGRKSAAMQEES